MIEHHKKNRLNGFKAGVFALLLLLIAVGLIVGLLISLMGVEWFDSNLETAKPLISLVRYSGYISAVVFWKQIARFLSKDNQELYLELLKRRKQFIGIVILSELILVHRLFIF